MKLEQNQTQISEAHLLSYSSETRNQFVMIQVKSALKPNNFEKVFFLIILCLIGLFQSCKDEKRDIKNPTKLKNVKKIALASFLVNETYTIGGQEAEKKYYKDRELMEKFGTIHLVKLDSVIKSWNSNKKFIWDLDEMIQSKEYKSLNIESRDYSKSRTFLSLPWKPAIKYIAPFKSMGVIKIDSTQASRICKTLRVDAILSIEIEYNFDNSRILEDGPFKEVYWWASSKMVAKLFDSEGEMLWKCRLRNYSPLKVVSKESFYYIIGSRDVISGPQTIKLIKSVGAYSSARLVSALYEDTSHLQ